jgi:hypothetical protein
MTANSVLNLNPTKENRIKGCIDTSAALQEMKKKPMFILGPWDAILVMNRTLHQ